MHFSLPHACCILAHLMCYFIFLTMLDMNNLMLGFKLLAYITMFLKLHSLYAQHSDDKRIMNSESAWILKKAAVA
jgi:hypothetical protein